MPSPGEWRYCGLDRVKSGFAPGEAVENPVDNVDNSLNSLCAASVMSMVFAPRRVCGGSEKVDKLAESKRESSGKRCARAGFDA